MSVAAALHGDAAAAASALRARYRAAGIRPAKRLGQHFLADLNLARKIVAELGPPDPASPVLEIGPGLGALTFLLAEAGHTVVAVEIDPRLADWLGEALAPWPHVTVASADIRTFPLDRVAAATRLRVVGNLPYYLTSEILLLLKREAARIASAVVMMQDEVAARLLAHPGSRAYSSLTVALALDFAIAPCFRVPRQAFWPAPDVDSAIIRLTPLAAAAGGALASPARRALVERVVRAGFAHRRKTLASSLAAELPIPRLRLETHLRALDLDPTRRAETLAPADFVRLAAALAVEIAPHGAENES